MSGHKPFRELKRKATDLERVREALLAIPVADADVLGAVAIIDAHLKEDAARDYELAVADYPGKKQLVAELTELREHARKYEKMWAKQVRQLTELREAVREIAEAPTYDSDAGDMCFAVDTKDIARQLIEDVGR